MNDHNFQLHAHPMSKPPPGVHMSGRLQRRHHKLFIYFVLHDPMQAVRIDPPADVAARIHGLWEQTCFECFITAADSATYWEINLSPTGHWNIYRFDGYRRGMREEPSFSALPVMLTTEDQTLRLTCEVDLGPIINPHQPIKIGLSAVLQLTGGEGTYWALAHPGPRPDFHHRDGFVMGL